MKYLLSKTEYDKLIRGAEREREQLKSTLQKLCTTVANHVPVLFWDNTEKKIWGCILSNNVPYCDQCPVQEECPKEYKKYSK